jgi:hypothetical protein
MFLTHRCGKSINARLSVFERLKERLINNTGGFADTILSKNKNREEKRICALAASLKKRCNLFEKKTASNKTTNIGEKKL